MQTTPDTIGFALTLLVAQTTPCIVGYTDNILYCCLYRQYLVLLLVQTSSDADTSDELHGQLASSSEEDSGTFHTEVGYESDSESSQSDTHKMGKCVLSSVSFPLCCFKV